MMQIKQTNRIDLMSSPILKPWPAQHTVGVPNLRKSG